MSNDFLSETPSYWGLVERRLSKLEENDKDILAKIDTVQEQQAKIRVDVGKLFGLVTGIYAVLEIVKQVVGT